MTTIVYGNNICERLQQALCQKLAAHRTSHFDVTWLEQTQSTNNDVKTLVSRLSLDDHTIVCVANCQTAGKGTHGRVWVAPKASLLMTVGVPLQRPLEQSMGITLAIGDAIASVLSKINGKIRIKWPNDLWINGRKTVGILCETQNSIDLRRYLIIGIGINIFLGDVFEIRQNLTSYRAGALFEKMPSEEVLDRLRIDMALDVAIGCDEVVRKFDSNSIKRLMKIWPKRDALFGVPARFTTPDEIVYEGFSVGIDEKGRLLFESKGKRYSFVDGTLRPVQTQGEMSK